MSKITKQLLDRQNDYIENNHSDKDDDDNSSDGKLKIVLEDEDEPSQECSRKKNETAHDSGSENSDMDEDKPSFDKSVEKKLRDIAKKYNMDDLTVRIFIRKLVRNEHVLALVKIKEEQFERAEKQRTIADQTDSFTDQPITRLKAKELIQNNIPVPMLQKQQAKSEVAVLIQEEFNSDDEDEEYRPGEDDFHSDDDNTTISDYDSQPRTPATPFQSNHEIEDSPRQQYSQDGVFKVPLSLNESQQKEVQEIIARRTRSKVCLQATPIETIESTFIPPDITTDMYDFDCDMDSEWKEFLNDFQMPFNNNENDDDESDPEYNVAADKITVDREELKESRVPKKEVNDLIKEFCGLMDLDDNIDGINMLFPQIPDSQLNTPNNSFETSKPSPRLKNKNSNTETTPIHINMGCNESKINSESVSSQNDNVGSSFTVEGNSDNIFKPNIMSTPTNNGTNKTPYVQTDLSTVPTGVFCPPTKPAITVNNANPINATQFVIQQTPQPTSTVGTFFITDNQNNVYQFSNMNGLICPNGILQYPSTPQYIIPVSTVQQPLPETAENKAPDNLTDDHKHEEISRKYRAMERRYRYLNTVSPSKVVYDSNAKGFTELQRKILDQQLRMHVQLLTQNFLQTYGHPLYYQHANTFKKLLNEFVKFHENVNNHINSAWNIWNLRKSIEFCDNWVGELAVDNKSSRQYFRYINAELEKGRRKYSQSLPQIPKKLQLAIFQSNIFVYPKLLPKTAYRMLESSRAGLIPSEDFLIAHGLEKFMEIQKAKLGRNKKGKKPNLASVCHEISAHIIKNKNGEGICNYVRQRKLPNAPMNPIKYYFVNNKAPPISFELEEFNPNKVLALKDYEKGQLNNDIWDKFFSSKEWLGYIHNESLIAKGLNPEYISDDDDDDYAQVKNGFFKVKNSNSKLGIPKIKVIVENITQSQYNELLKKQNLNKSEISCLNDYKTKEDTFNSTVDNCDNSSQSDSLSSISTAKISIKSLCECCHCLPNEKSLNKSIPKGQKLLTEFFPLSSNFSDQHTDASSDLNFSSLSSKSDICDKIADTLQYFHENYDYFKINLNDKKLLLDCYNYFKAFDIYTQLLIDLKMHSNFHIDLNDYPEFNTNGMNSIPTTSTSNTSIVLQNSESSGTKTGSKSTVTSVGQLNINLSNSTPKKSVNDERYYNYANNFYDKVKETFLAENNIRDYDAFQNLLLNFDYENDTVPDLYYKMEKLFYPRHQELAELFLTFLLPGHAAQIGKFFEHFMLTNMTSFISKLNLYYSKQPSQIRKIYSYLNELASDSNVTMGSIKTKILPLLKGNQLLSDWFLQLFPSGKPPEPSINEYETIRIQKFPTDVLNDNLYEYENISPSEVFPDSDNPNCGIKYLQGRIYYGNRVLLPAKLSFLAYDILPISKMNSKNKKALDNSQQKSVNESECCDKIECVHNFGEFGLNGKTQNCSTSKVNDNNSSHKGESDLNIENTSIINEDLTKINKTKYVLCNDATLKQHAIRLNPIIYGNNDHSTTKDDSSDSSFKTSPKRQIHSHAQTTSSLSTSSTNKNKLSMTNGTNKKQSPNTKKLTQSPNSESETFSARKEGIIPNENSPAIKTAKRLRNLINDGSSSEDDRPISERMEEWKICELSFRKKNKLHKIENRDKSEPKKLKSKRTKKVHESDSLSLEQDVQNEDKSFNNENLKFTAVPSTSKQSDLTIAKNNEIEKKPTTNVWTRDEDKVILEAINSNLTDEDKIFEVILDSLQNRSHEAIVERYHFLMDLLKQFQGKS